MCMVYFTFISCLFVVYSKLLSPLAVERPDALLHEAECNSASGRLWYQGVIVDCTTNRHEITVLLPNPFDEIHSSVP